MRGPVPVLAKRLGLGSPLGIGLFAAAGVALAVAIVTLSVQVSSNEYAASPPSEELSVALAGNLDDCYDSNFIGYSSSGVDLGPVAFDLNDPSQQTLSGFLCIGNFGPTNIGEILVSPVSSADGEDGCSSSEAVSDPEGPGCGSAGELHPLLVFGFTSVTPAFPPPSNAVECTDAEAGDLETGDVTPSLFASSLDSGQVCGFEIYIRLDEAATEDQKVAASTDSSEFAIEVAGTAVGG